MRQTNPCDQWTILFIAGIAQISGIVTIWIPVTARCLEDTLFAIFTRPPIRVLNSWEASVTLAFAELISHVFVVFTQGLSLGTTGKMQSDTTAFVT